MKLKTFFFRFNQGEVNATQTDDAVGISDHIDERVNNWLLKNPGIRLLELKSQCADHNDKYVVMISILYQDAVA